jgi:hypothetical protein
VPSRRFPLPLPPPAPKRRGREALFIVLGLVGALIVLAGVGGLVLLSVSQQNQLNQQAAAAPTPPGPTPTATPNVIFYDTLTNGSAGKVGWIDTPGQCVFRPDGYHLATFTCYAPVGDLRNGVIEAQVSQASGDLTAWHGIVFRRVSKGNYCAFQITNDGYWHMVKVVNGTVSEVVPYGLNQAIQKGLNASNTLKVTADGPHFEFFVNSTEVGQADDSTSTSGATGLKGVQGGEAVFIKLSVATLPS